MISMSAFAHRENYFEMDFGTGSPTDNGWTIAAGTLTQKDGVWGVVPDATGLVNFQRDLSKQAGTRSQPYLGVAVIKYTTGTGEESETPHIDLTARVRGTDSNYKVMFQFSSPESDPTKVVCDTSKTIIQGAPYTQEVRYLNIYFRNCKPNEFISLKYINFASDWLMPEVANDKTTYIQAEDYDDYCVNNHKGYLGIEGGANQYRPTDSDLYIRWQDDGAAFNSWVYGNDHAVDWYGRAVINMCRYSSWNEYKGEYVDETSNVITKENATNNFGTWLEYTFDVPDDCYADISLKAGSNWNAYGAVAGGTGKFGKARADGGYVVEGMTEDWVKRYVGGVVLSLDGADLRTNWDSHPKSNGDKEGFRTLLNDPSTGWTNNQILKDGIVVNSDTLYITPNPNGDDMTKWHAHYKSDVYDNLRTTTGNEDFAKYVKPDYINVPLKKGRHTIKVKSLAAMWVFDELRLVGKKTMSGVDTNISDKEGDKLIIYPSLVSSTLNIKGEETNYAIIDLRSGLVVKKGIGNSVDVSDLSAGVYAIKANSGTQRFIKK